MGDGYIVILIMSLLKWSGRDGAINGKFMIEEMLLITIRERERRDCLYEVTCPDLYRRVYQIRLFAQQLPPFAISLPFSIP